ncbi:MAG TPA: acetate/propionate family kinase [Ktedonobacterales bacterium]
MAVAMKILALNSGSSSLKFALYESSQTNAREPLALELAGAIERIGLQGAHARIHDAAGQTLAEAQPGAPDHHAAIRWLLDWLRASARLDGLAGVGHRIAHGGPDHFAPERITPELRDALTRLIPFAPEHLPAELDVVAAMQAAYPEAPHIACFDTAFHHDKPRVAQLFGLPWELAQQGILRYGFHGLSYEYTLSELARLAGAAVAGGRVIIAHLGNGASMAAIHGGRSLDCTMGFSPLSGLVMSTRSGSLDPGVLLYLLEERHMTPQALRALVSAQAGLLGVSGLSPDVRDLLAAEARGDERASLALDLFCYEARKALGGLVAILGGLDTLVFTGGIGEHAAAIRQRIGDGLAAFGVALDPQRNDAHAPVISARASRVEAHVIPTNEELMIARHTIAALRAEHPQAT